MTTRSLSLVLAAFVSTTAALAADSPQFRGANRTGIFDETGLMKAWPENGPPLLWKADGFGVGYSSADVVKDRIYVTGTLAEQDSFIFVLDLDGKVIDKIPYGKDTSAEAAPGARCTPTIDGDRMYLLNGLGPLLCIDLKTKAIVWQVNILERFKAPQTEWHLAEALLIDGNHVICTPGGEDAAMAALDKNTGDTVWVTKGLTDMTSYVPPLLVNHNGRRIIFTETSKYLICVDADSGELLWKHEHLTQYDIHAVTPIYRDGCLYYVAGYKSGGGLLELSKDASSYTVKWLDTQLDCQHHGVVLVDGCIYGTTHHRGGGQMVCLDWATGAVKWTSKEVSQGTVEYADGMLYTYEGPKKGVVSLIKPNPAALERTGKFTVNEGDREHWAHPTIANGRLYVRHGDALLCYDIRQK
jgi:outer membrane protein assembly factor BamB